MMIMMMMRMTRMTTAADVVARRQMTGEGQACWVAAVADESMEVGFERLVVLAAEEQVSDLQQHNH